MAVAATAAITPFPAGDAQMCKTVILFSAMLLLVAPIARGDDKAQVAADEQAKAVKILDQGIKAHGGEAALGKFVACSFKMHGNEFVDDKKVPKNVELYAQGVDKMRSIILDEAGKKPTYIEVINGQEGWVKEGNQEAEELPESTVASESDEVYLNWATMLVPLKKPGVQLSTVKDETVAGRKAAGILVKAEKHRPFKFYFDAQTHLLVMCEMVSKRDESQDDVVVRLIWSDFQDAQGTKQPMKLSELWDGVEISDGRITELKFYEKPLDAKLFEKP
jgi:hypothetical protein